MTAALVLSEQSLLRMRICASPWSRSSHLLCTAPSPGQSSPCLPTSVELGLSHSLSLVSPGVASGRQEEWEGEAGHPRLW